MIILEGPDRCGKSTVAEMLQALLPGHAYRHHSVPPVSPYLYYSWFLADSHRRMVVDRLHLSELAYGKTYRGRCDLSRHEWRLLNLMLMGQEAWQLTLNDDPESLRERWDREPFSKDKIAELASIFSDPGPEWEIPIPVIKLKFFDLANIDARDPKPTEQLLQVAAREAQACSRSSRLLPASLGFGATSASIRPLGRRYLVLGESPAERKSAGDLTPQTPFGSEPGSSNWLWKALDDNGISAYDGYFTNASAFGSAREFAEYLAQMIQPEHVVCLGSKARDLFEKAAPFMGDGAPTSSRHRHPTYVDRFMGGEYTDWANEVGTALEGWRAVDGK